MSTVRNTAIGIGLFWLVVLLLVIVQSLLDVPVAGVAPEATRLTLIMTLPLTLGASAVIIGVTYLIRKRRERE